MKKGITVILALTLALGLGLGGLSIARNAKSTKEFVADGFILDPSDEEYVTTNVDTQYYFAQGAKYKEKFGTQILFKDTAGNDNTIDTAHFVHYNDGSLGAFTKGVIMDVSELSESNYGYYSLTKNTILVKNGNAYEMKSRGESLNITEYIWKISDTDYMLVSPNSTLTIGSEEVQFPDYVQITYVDNGIVRLSHQQGTYQTVSADSELVTQGGAELNLVGKSFMVNGDPILSLDDMTIDDSSYIDVEENIKDQLNIPTFNVINGKDGANGTDGTDGEKGEEGKEGEEGEEGEEGNEGTIGQEGVIGTEGTIGKDGVEGDTGIMGFDGAEGNKGKDATNAADATGIAAVDLKARPTVTMEAGDNAQDYEVTSGSATFTLSMDANDSLKQGTTKIKLFNRKTMELVTETENPNDQEALGQTLENSPNGATFNFAGLQADTEYLLQIEGTYKVSDDAPETPGIFFQKIFKTQPLGISLAKDYVTDTEIAAATKVTGQVDSYTVRFFYYDENQQKVTIAAYTKTDNTSGSFKVNDTDPAPGSYDRPNTFKDIKSNTKYYAELANVTSGSKAVATDGSVVELLTLKETPYDTAEWTNNNNKRYIQGMTPTLTPDEKTQSLTVNMDAFTDPDAGITGYRVELYKQGDVNSAANTGDYDSLKPAYTRELEKFGGCTFSITDNESYMARVIAIFNDNEKEVELTSLFSNAEALSGVSSSLKVEFDDVTVGADSIKGYVKITDGNGNISANWASTEVLQYICNTYPLKLEVVGEFQDTYTLSVPWAVDQNGAKGFSKDGTDANGYDTVDKNQVAYWRIPFYKEGLHNKSVYTLRVLGPQNTDKLNGIDKDAEKSVYLTGARVTTGTNGWSALAAKKVVDNTVAFKYQLAFTNPEGADDTETKANETKSKYALNAMEKLELQLVQVDATGEKILGNTYTVVDSDNRTHNSIFGEGAAWIDRSKVSENTDPDLAGLAAGTKGLVFSDNSASTITVQPSNFGILDNDNALFSGGMFKIKVKNAYDYTYQTEYDGDGNDIPFKQNEDVVIFGIENKHMTASDCADTVSVDLLPNSAAADGYSEDNLSDDTIVGMRFSANYSYSDVKEIEYYIYKVSGTSITDSVDNPGPPASHTNGTYLYPKNGTDMTAAVKLNSEVDNGDGTYTTSYDSTEQAELVLRGKHVSNGDERRVGTVEVYFNGTKSLPNYDVQWMDRYGSALPPDTTVLKRGERYIIAYKVLADHEITPCISPTSDHTYPDCAYKQTQAKPLYRSKIIALNRQMPVVERYPMSSDNNSETWNYRIIDPDNAIVDDNDPVNPSTTLTIRQANDYAGVATGTVSTVSMAPMTATDYRNNNAFKSIAITNLQDQKYYTVSIPYKNLANDTTESYITSKPVQHFATVGAANVTNVTMKGLDPAGEIYDPSDLTSGLKLKPILNQGNYRYRLTIQGNDLKKYAAFRVVVNDTTKSKTVIYDPVYISEYSTYGSSNIPYGYAYLDQGALKNAGCEAGDSCTVTISGYYSTKSSGFDGYSGSLPNFNNKTLWESDSTKENIYAFRYYSGTAAGTYYRLLGDEGFSLTKEGGAIPNASVYIPGTTQNTGINITSTAGNKSSAMISMRYAKNPFSIAADPTSVLLSRTLSGLSFDETGIHSADTYFTMEKLAKSSPINWDENANTIKIGAIMAAIEKNRISPGVTTAVLEMKMSGDSDGTLYARVQPKNAAGSYLHFTKTDAGNGEWYYKVEAGSPEDYCDDIPINAGDKTVKLRLRGLTNNTAYQVQFYTKDADDKIRPLYSIDGATAAVGLQYEFITLTSINIDLQQPTYTYTNYGNKNASFRFGIPGDDGIGMTMHWAAVNGIVTDPNATEWNNNNIGSGTIEKLDGSPEYYSQNPADNNPFTVAMNPGTGPIILGGSYSVKVWAISDSGGENMGNKIITFQAPSSLGDPSVTISGTSSASSISVQCVCTDAQKSVYQGKYTVSLYKTSDTSYSSPVATVSDVDAPSAGNESHTWTHTFGSDANPLENGDYIARAEVQIDTNNDGSVDDTLYFEKMVNTGSRATATLGPSATKDSLTLRFSNLNNFDSVSTINVTLHKSGGMHICDSVITVTDQNKTDGTFEVVIPEWASSGKTEEGTWYDLTVQYRSSSNGYLGDGELSFQTSTSNN